MSLLLVMLLLSGKPVTGNPPLASLGRYYLGRLRSTTYLGNHCVPFFKVPSLWWSKNRRER